MSYPDCSLGEGSCHHHHWSPQGPGTSEVHRGRREPYVDALMPPVASTSHDCGRRGRHFGAQGEDCQGRLNQINLPALVAKSLQYFKNIEMVANELGFQQMLPRKRDSVVESSPFAPDPYTNGIKLEVPELSVSCSSSPVLDAMSSRISQNDVDKASKYDDPDEVPLLSMSARLSG